jgi:hypothetical protein
MTNVPERDENGVLQEQTGWRDQAYSRWHRTRGYDLPFSNVDWLYIEFDQAEVVAQFELKCVRRDYQHHDAETGEPCRDDKYEKYLAGKTCHALAMYAQRSKGPATPNGTPFFVVRYMASCDWFLIHPVNAAARMKLSEARLEPDVPLGEVRFLEFLYGLRDLELPAKIRDEVNQRDGGDLS